MPIICSASMLMPFMLATLQGGRAVHLGGTYGIRTGEGPSLGEVARHTVTIYNHHVDQVITVEVPEDRWAAAAAAWKC
jgi:hypothetical protein